MIDRLLYAFSALMFTAIVLVGLMVYGNEQVRALALAAALLAAVSQYIAQTPSAWVVSILCAYATIGVTAYAVWLML